MKKLSIYKVKVKYGRGECESSFLIAATSTIVAKRLANQASVLPVSKGNIDCVQIINLIPAENVKKSSVIYHL